jgi:hypothetical protein
MPDQTPRTRPKPLTMLIDTFDRLFPDEELSRVVVTRAGIEDGLIAYSPRSIENWTNIVKSAIAQNALDDLVAAASELHPNVPELRHHLADYRKWCETHSADQQEQVELAAKPPGFFERTRVVMTAWFSVGLACSALIGVMARDSMMHFFDLPSAHIAEAFTSPGPSAEAGLRFVGRTAVLIGTYVSYNPLGALLAVALGAASLYFSVRRPKWLERAYRPAVTVTLVIVAALAKTFLYDYPTVSFTRVLTTFSVDVATFDPPQMFFGRANKIWTGVVCSRIGNLQGDFVERLCGDASPRDHLQNLIGGYLLNVLFTIAICTLGIATLRKLTLPSHDARWNLPRTWKWALVTATGLALLTALLAVPWTYARTVASMEDPYICTSEDCSLRICPEEDDCYAFIPADADVVKTGPLQDAAQYRTEDVLQTAFRVQLQAPEVEPHDRASRLGGN